MMSIVCCKELKGWCKSFTRTETYLSVLQVFFLVILIVSLTFIILHFLACYKIKNTSETEQIIETSSQRSTITEEEEFIETTTTTNQKDYITNPTQLPKGIECTWTPSVKTTAITHYYDIDLISLTTAKRQPTVTIQTDNLAETGTSALQPSEQSWTQTKLSNADSAETTNDGKEADNLKKDSLLALVKIKPPLDITFGCTLTIVAESWTLTAASCVEAIEEVDSLDSFVMMRGFGEKNEGSIHTVSDILIHPQYQGVNRTYDLAALKSEDSVVIDKNHIVTLPTMVDYLSVTIGESFSILGFGKYRNLDKDPRSRSIREVSVYSLPSQQCPEVDGDAWSLRHLSAGRRELRGGCGAGPLCAAGRRARGPCRYCAGTPLLRGRLLLAVMSDNPHCGLACVPALYVNLASLRDWVDSVIYSD